VSSPLVSRPPYGEVTGESGLPKGDPAGRGVGLDPEIPGSSTFAKPPEEGPREPRKDNESIHRVDDADDLLKDQSRSDEIDHSHAKPTYRRPGPHDETNKTKYPYRDGVPNAHNGSVVFAVAHNWMAETALEVPVSIEAPIKVAATLGEVVTGLGPHVLQRAQTCSATLKRADVPNLRWLFTVDCGNGPKTVKMKASRSGKMTALSKMDVSFTCSCHAWRWLGSEYHAKKETYLDGKPRGTASFPKIKDPDGVNRVCKHVSAVIGTVKKWQVPIK
jgi:hypothetical protein